MVVPSHHIGDLEHLATYRSFLQAVDHLCGLYGVRPEVVAHDLHPEYLSTKLAARARPAHARRPAPPRPRRGLHGRARPHGAGAGPRLRRPRATARTATLWGGELLVADLAGYERVGAPRGRCRCRAASAAIREPWRMAAVWAARRPAGAAPSAAPCPASTERARGRARPRRARSHPAHHEHGPPVRRRRRAARGPAAGELRGPGGDRARGAGPHGRPADAPTYDGTVTVADVGRRGRARPAPPRGPAGRRA